MAADARAYHVLGGSIGRIGEARPTQFVWEGLSRIEVEMLLIVSLCGPLRRLGLLDPIAHRTLAVNWDRLSSSTRHRSDICGEDHVSLSFISDRLARILSLIFVL